VTAGDLFSRLIAALDAAEVPYMLTGSYASSLHGLPRATRDVDLVIVPTREQLTRLMEQFPSSSYYADLEDAIDALRRRSQFNVIDLVTGWKVDFIIPPLTEFQGEEFERRRLVELEGVRLYVASPEDILIAKLRWAKEGQSDRQLEDAAGVIAGQGANLDVAYVERWVGKLGLAEEWRMAREKSALDPR
jgi:hypothetical protein